MKLVFISQIILTALLFGCSNMEPVDVLFVNANIHSIDTMHQSYTAMAVKDGKVYALGERADLEARFQAKSIVDLDGKHIFPGFIDAHCHLYGLGEQQLIADLVGTHNPDEVVARLKEHLPNIGEGSWLRGRGWDQNDWPSKEFPSKDLLDAAFPDTPVFLVRVDGHAAWVNSKALEIAGITANTASPNGGKIGLHNGMLTGILIDNAIELVRSHIPATSDELLQHGFSLAIKRCLEYGITGVHDMGVNASKIRAIKSMIAQDKFPFRVTAYIDGRGDEWEQLLADDERIFGEMQLILAGLKMYADGALGSRGALLLEPYEDDPGNIGVQISSESDITKETIRAIGQGLQVCVHAIGDSANRLVLNAYEVAIRQTGAKNHGLRIEHCQVLHPDDVARFSALGVIPSMQPTHCTSDMYWAESRLGPNRVTGAYIWKSLLETGVLLPFGSDFPVEHPNPIDGIYAACTRKDKEGKPSEQSHIENDFNLSQSSTIRPKQYEHGWFGDEALSRIDALKGFSSSAARVVKQEKYFGTLSTGSYADFFVIDVDLSSCSDEALLNSAVYETWVGGQIQYSKSEGSAQ
jgi:predicted amidohydrolase YtcJ